MLHIYGGLGGFFALAGAVLLVIVSVGVPVWDRVYFLSISWYGCEILLGQWGYCFVSSGSGQTCSHASIGYATTFTSDGLPYGPKTITAIPDHLTAGLILHPIAAGLALLAFLVSLDPHLLAHIMGSLVALLASIFAIAALAWDTGIFVSAKVKLGPIDSHLSTAFWLVLASVPCLAVATCTICFMGVHHRRAIREMVYVEQTSEAD